MTGMPNLKTSLLDLLHELKGKDIPLIIGGGFGIYLLYTDILTLKKTLFNELPEPRSTNDIDLFLHAELLLNSERLEPLAHALTTLGYQVIPTAAKYQFIKPGPDGDLKKGIKIDVLTGSTRRFINTHVKFDKRRVQPKPSVELHAHPCEEALTLEEGATTHEIDGVLSNGSPFGGSVLLPHPFTFLSMKLHALRDQMNNADKDNGRHHALDLYTVMGTMTDETWQASLAMRDHHRGEAVLIECSRIVGQLFSTIDSPGTIRLRESTYFHPQFLVREFIDALKELFPAQST